MKEEKEKQNDEDLRAVKQCLEGDIEAFESIVSRYQKPMLNVAFRMLDSYDDACDVLQEAFIAAYKGLRKYRSEARFSTWLHAIVMNRARNRLKQKGSRGGRELRIDAPITKEDGSIYIDVASKDRSALEILESDDIRERVHKCIAGLEEDFRAVIILRDLQGLSYDEIAETLGIPSGTVRSRLFRAREGVKDCLVKLMGDHGEL
ncbi:MAG: sigma-70 family RNA polymerase sigma factor [Nitrospirota bacterium]|nr:MAG: sigma-70 family RNA polymerase sigma factor [Nitrospirota bacterium]